MKIEFEIDSERVYNEVVEALVRHMKYELSSRLDQAIKGEIVQTLLMEVKELARKKIPDIRLSDGRSIEDYVTDLLTSRAKDQDGDWRRRSRIHGMIDGEIMDRSHEIFKKIVEPHITDLREGILKSLVESLLSRIKAA